MVALTATRHWLSKIHQIVAGATVFPAIWAPNTVVAPFELTNYPVSASLWRFSFSTYSTGPTTPSGPNKRRSWKMRVIVCCTLWLLFFKRQTLRDFTMWMNDLENWKVCTERFRTATLFCRVTWVFYTHFVGLINHKYSIVSTLICKPQLTLKCLWWYLYSISSWVWNCLSHPTLLLSLSCFTTHLIRMG